MSNKLENNSIITNIERFGIQRRIVAHMTTKSWKEIPHVTAVYEPDVTEFYRTFKALQKNYLDSGKDKITFNTVMLKVITEGLKAAPALNSTLKFNPFTVTGTLTRREDIDISIPWTLPTGEMMTITLPDVQTDSLEQFTKKIQKISNKVQNTNCTEAMYEVSFDQTINELKKGNFGVLARVAAAKIGHHKIKLLSGSEKSKYYEIPSDDRLTLNDLRQGTVTISNIGSIHRSFTGYLAMLEIIPPQIFTVGICNTQVKPLSILHDDGTYTVESRTVCPMCLAGDHRAIDYGDMVPFIDRLDDIFEHPEQIIKW